MYQIKNVTRYDKRDHLIGIKFHFLIIAKMCGRFLFFTFLFFILLENVDFGFIVICYVHRVVNYSYGRYYLLGHIQINVNFN